MFNKSIREYSTAAEAYNSTTEDGRIAVKVTTYVGEDKTDVEFYSYISEYDTPDDLCEDFPLCLWSNQSIQEIESIIPNLPSNIIKTW